MKDHEPRYSPEVKGIPTAPELYKHLGELRKHFFIMAIRRLKQIPNPHMDHFLRLGRLQEVIARELVRETMNDERDPFN